MQPVPGGRYCPKCAHTVPDLTDASDAELAQHLHEGTMPKCARFSVDQLDRDLLPVGRDPVHALHLLVLTAMSVLPMAAEAKRHKKPLRIRPVEVFIDDHSVYDHMFALGRSPIPQLPPGTCIDLIPREELRIFDGLVVSRPHAAQELITTNLIPSPGQIGASHAHAADPRASCDDMHTPASPGKPPADPPPAPDVWAVLTERIGIRSLLSRPRG